MFLVPGPVPFVIPGTNRLAGFDSAYRSGPVPAIIDHVGLWTNPQPFIERFAPHE